MLERRKGGPCIEDVVQQIWEETFRADGSPSQSSAMMPIGELNRSNWIQSIAVPLSKQRIWDIQIFTLSKRSLLDHSLHWPSISIFLVAKEKQLNSFIEERLESILFLSLSFISQFPTVKPSGAPSPTRLALTTKQRTRLKRSFLYPSFFFCFEQDYIPSCEKPYRP